MFWEGTGSETGSGVYIYTYKIKEPIRANTKKDRQATQSLNGVGMRGPVFVECTLPTSNLPDAVSWTGLWIRIHFLRIRIRIRSQSLMLEANTDPDPDPDPIRIPGFNDQKLEKITAENFLLFFLIKNCNLPIPRPP